MKFNVLKEFENNTPIGLLIKQALCDEMKNHDEIREDDRRIL